MELGLGWTGQESESSHTNGGIVAFTNFGFGRELPPKKKKYKKFTKKKKREKNKNFGNHARREFCEFRDLN